ncbi:uncharacterized protein LOC106138793 isoform X1 [Amyelois transitella]|uniref:uncharacterized protein LOC106138793 isoform X1 n=1 Tax=Amyelois transitella TaxID=680683 RepID=UPI00298FD225|nr:uncharacterized protein LOC106138793 isoform X1 [Amyelois transitella]
MLRHFVLLALGLQLTQLTLVETAQQYVKLSDSYLPVAMQVIAHLTDQMAFEVKDEPQQPTKKPTTPKATTRRPEVTSKPYVGQYTLDSFYPGPFQSFASGWVMKYGWSLDQTTAHHKPGLFAPNSPPRPIDRILPKSPQRFVLLPLEYNSQYTVIEPLERRTEEPLLSIQDEEVRPLMEPNPEAAPLLPPHFPSDKLSRSEDGDENLQYLSETVRDMIKMARDPDDERLVDVFGDTRAGPTTGNKASLSSSNLRLLLLYDLLSREAKRQKLSDYGGFSPAVMKTLVGSSDGGARAQLSLALSKMLERNDCEHQYANNRAKEMVAELAKDESKLSSELRYLQPLVYSY